MQKTKIRYLNIRKRNELMVKNRKRRLRSVILFILENETVLYSGNSNIRAIKLFIKLVSSDFFLTNYIWKPFGLNSCFSVEIAEEIKRRY